MSDPNRAFLDAVASRAVTGEGLTSDEGLRLLQLPDALWPDVLAAADRVRRAHHGRRVRLCTIVNARSGRCSEDCAFCAQSVRHATGAPAYPLKSVKEITAAALAARQAGASEFSIVTSGRGAGGHDDFARILEAVRRIEALGLTPCASLGLLEPDQFVALREAGLVRCHHNLEAAASFFPRICTTHTFADHVAAARAALDAGLELCCGGIFGLGESAAQRVELVMAVRDLGAHSMPVNFLIPVPGTPLAERELMTPHEALRVIALARLAMPGVRIVICGGREVVLRSLQTLVFAAGATGIQTGDYLTTAGQPPEQDRRMIADLGLEGIAPGG